jgi:hypothetical protein
VRASLCWEIQRWGHIGCVCVCVCVWSRGEVVPTDKKRVPRWRHGLVSLLCEGPNGQDDSLWPCALGRLVQASGL